MIIAAALFIIGTFFTFAVKKLPRFSTVCYFMAACGATGWILDIFQTGAGWITTMSAFLIAPVVLLTGASLWLILRIGHDLWPKNKGAANRQTVLAALFLPLILTMVSWPVGDAILRFGHGMLSASSNLGGVI